MKAWRWTRYYTTRSFLYFFQPLLVCLLLSKVSHCRLPTHTHSHSQAAIINSRSAKMTNAPIQFLATTTTTTTRKVKKKRSPKADRNRDWRRSVPQSTCGSLMSHSHTFFRRRKPLNHVLRYVKGTQKNVHAKCRIYRFVDLRLIDMQKHCTGTT